MRLPALSGLPAIFQDFFGLEFSVPHFGHFAILFFLPNRLRIMVFLCWKIKDFPLCSDRKQKLIYMD